MDPQLTRQAISDLRTSQALDGERNADLQVTLLTLRDTRPWSLRQGEDSSHFIILGGLILLENLWGAMLAQSTCPHTPGHGKFYCGAGLSSNTVSAPHLSQKAPSWQVLCLPVPSTYPSLAHRTERWCIFFSTGQKALWGPGPSYTLGIIP